MPTVKKDRIYKVLILAVFACLIYQVHIPMTYVHDDLAVLEASSAVSFWENFLVRYYQNGRIFTDGLQYLLVCMPLGLWKMLDTVVYLIIAALISYLFTKNSWTDLLAACCLILLFPFFYLRTAGYIATTTNYVYTVLGILIALVPFKRRSLGRSVPFFFHIFSFLGILYAANQDQTAMVLIGGLLLYLIYALVTKQDRYLVRLAAAYLAMAAGCYLLMLLMPGHTYRMTAVAGMEEYAEFAHWNLFQKIYHGYTATVAHLMFDQVTLFGLFCLLLFLTALQQGSLMKKCTGAVPVILLLAVNAIGSDTFTYDENWLPELLPVSAGPGGIAALVISVVIVVCIFYTVCTCVRSKPNRLLMLLLLVLAAGSKEMMGFSPTIYGSSYRTFTFFMYALIVCCLLLLEELRSRGRWSAGMAVILAAMLF